MKKTTKSITAVAAAAIMAAGMAVSASAGDECAHTTYSFSIKEPYYERYAYTHNHKVGGFREDGTEYTIYKSCDVYNKYAQQYWLCASCGKSIKSNEVQVGVRHDVTPL